MLERNLREYISIEHVGSSSIPALVQEYNSIKEEILLKVGADNRAAYVDMKEKEYKWFFEKVLQGN